MRPAVSLARRMVRAARSQPAERVPREVTSKVKTALLDYLSCALESLPLGPSQQAIAMVTRYQHGQATVIGTPIATSPGEAAFVNAVQGHGLVREDMHTGSVSHLGIVLFPVLLAQAQRRSSHGREFIAAAMCGYEAGAAVGRAVMSPENVRIHRPTGITGPIAGAVAGSLLAGLDEDAAVSAVALAANTVSGFNEWPRYGADEMFFHAGFAARNAVTSVDLAAAGAQASETALCGDAGLFAALGRQERAAATDLFRGSRPEILEVYHKPAPACNYAQTACQAAQRIAREEQVPAKRIGAVRVRCSAAALNYPGCAATGPFERVLQAKMSIRFCVAATLARGAVEEANYRRLSDPEILRLVGVTSLEEGAEYTRAYPERQGTAVAVTLDDGRVIESRLDDVIPATPEEVATRFRLAAASVLGRVSADIIEAAIDSLEEQEDVGILSALLAAK